LTEEELYRIYYEARAELAKYPGVAGVGLGLKERDGALTRETAFRVYVYEKKSPSELDPAAHIPPSYKGVPTDVLKVREAIPNYANEDRVKHDPLIGGITISPQRAPGWLGTLGFFAVINGVEGPDNIALVTNNHVLAKNGGRVKDKVYQPNLAEGTLNHAIAKILRIPEIDNYTYQYPPALRLTPSEPAGQFWIDCGAAQLDICISSCCHTNCGVSFAKDIMGLNLATGNMLVDVDRARHGETVFKVGRTTRRTEGIVSDVAAVVSGGGLTATGILEVTFVRADEPDVSKFGDRGDSGAAVVRSDGKLVGLHYSAAATPDKSLNSHIHPVLDALALTAVTRANPVTDNRAAVSMAGDVMAVVDGRPDHTAKLKQRFLAFPGAEQMADLVDQHRREVIQLVNQNRRVAVAWQRNKGPAFLNRAIHNVRDPQQRIPSEIEGVTRRTLLGNMGRALAEHGSPALRRAIERHRDQVLDYAEECDSLHDLLDRLTERQLA